MFLWITNKVSEKHPYLRKYDSEETSKGTLFSSNLKFGENNVASDSHFESILVRYGRFS